MPKLTVTPEIKLNDRIYSNDVNRNKSTNLKTINININTKGWVNFKQSNIEVSEYLSFLKNTFSCDQVDKHECEFKVAVKDESCKNSCSPIVTVNHPSLTDIFAKFTWTYNAPTVTNDSTEALKPTVSIEDKMDIAVDLSLIHI